MTLWHRGAFKREVLSAVLVAAIMLCVACGGARPRYHYYYSWKGGTMRGLPIAHDRQRTAATDVTTKAGEPGR